MRPFLPLLPAALLFTLVASSFAAPASSLPTGKISPPPTTPAQKTMLAQVQDAFVSIARTVEPSVVNIKAVRPADADSQAAPDPAAPPPVPKGSDPNALPNTSPRAPRRSEATGSGVIVRADGYILTNAHVVERAIDDKVTVTLFDGREFTGTVFSDSKSDLAVVKIDPGPDPLPVAPFADGAAEAVPGQWAIAVGSPFDLQNTVTVGIVSAVERHQYIPGEGGGDGRYYPDLIQTDAAINPGNSGGPLFDMNGKVIGINVAIESPVEGSAGVGFAIPVAIARPIADTLIAQGKVTRGYLGLAPDDLTPALSTQTGAVAGAFVRDVVLGSPADKAGLQAADVVTEFGGKPITDEITLRAAIAAARPGQKVPVSFVRDGKTLSAVATIDPSPVTAAETPSILGPHASPPAGLGLTVRDLTARDRVSQGLPPATQGVLITKVVPGSPAESENITTGTVLQKVNGVMIATKAQFDPLSARLAGSVTLVVIYQDPATSQVHQHAVTLRL